ncbi:MAG: hypothetical protein WCK77_23925, partial [Verrucomicrobiota bacterium]
MDKPFKTNGLWIGIRAKVDASTTAMNPTGDKLATTQETALSTTLPAPRPKAGILGLNAAFSLISYGFQPFFDFVVVATRRVPE